MVLLLNSRELYLNGVITINVGRLCIRMHADTWNNSFKSIPSGIPRLANYHKHRVVNHT